MARPARVSPDRILAAAAQEFAARGYAGARVDRIARRARVNKAMLYYHFRSKQGLYRALLRDTFHQVGARLQAVADLPLAPAPKLDRAIAELARFIGEHRFFPAIMLREVADGGEHLDRATLGALAAIPRVARTGAQLQRLAGYIDALRGWGRGLRRAIARWYLEQPLKDLELQALKYKARGEKGERWSHRDLLRLSHPLAPAEDVARRALFDRIVKADRGRPDSNAELPAELARFAAAERLVRTSDPGEAVRLITHHRLPREVVPTPLLNERTVWEALLAEMPMTAMLRSLGKLSQVGLLVPGSAAEWNVVARLADRDRLRRARIHPLQVLTAMAVYRSGHGVRGSLQWHPAPAVVDALDRAFYAAFETVVPSGKRLLLGLDVSASMGAGQVAGSPLTPREAATAMALVTLATEAKAEVVAFQDRLVPLALSPRQRLDDAVRATSDLPFGATDCAQPMLYAPERGLEVEAFVIYTDNETWAGAVHPSEALRRYRERTGIAARLVVVGLTSTGFTIADPEDAGMLDVVGFDAAAPALIGDFIAGRV